MAIERNDFEWMRLKIGDLFVELRDRAIAGKSEELVAITFDFFRA